MGERGRGREKVGGKRESKERDGLGKQECVHVHVHVHVYTYIVHVYT